MKQIMYALLAAFSTWSAMSAADDSDIYLNAGSRTAPPYLMITIDYRTNMGATYCTSCEEDLAAYPVLLASLKDVLDVEAAVVVDGTTTVTHTIQLWVDSGQDGGNEDHIKTHINDTVAYVFESDDADIVAELVSERDVMATAIRDLATSEKHQSKIGKFEVVIVEDLADGGTSYTAEIIGSSRHFTFLTDAISSVTSDPVTVDGTSTGGETLDKASNLSAAIAVMQVVFEQFSGIYVGLMMHNVNDGGTILRGYREFQENDANGAKAELTEILKNIPADDSLTGNQYHESSPKETHYELYRYLNGEGVLFGNLTSGNFPGGTLGQPPHDTDIMNADESEYITPFESSDFSCTKLYGVYATSGNKGNQDADLDSEITTDMSETAAGDDFTGMVRHMTFNDLVKNVDGEQTMKQWFIEMGQGGPKSDDWAEAADTTSQLMKVAGGGADLADMEATFKEIFIEALSVSTSFVAASVPVNVFNRTQTLDNFYIALFEASDTERWPGNLKKLKMFDTPSIDTTGDGVFDKGDGLFDEVVDVDDDQAFDIDARIKQTSLTFWTDASGDNLANPDTEKGQLEGKDGRAVERGGAGQKIPGFLSGAPGEINDDTDARQLYVEPATLTAGGTALTSFDATTANATSWRTLLGASTDAEALEIIQWARGIDVDNENLSGEVRPWLLGDAIHSRPLAINYGATAGYSETNPDIRIFMGTNGGFLHAFQNTLPGGDESGAEIFGFVPRELLGNFRQLRSNLGTFDHPYGMDSEAVAHVVDVDKDGTIESGDTVWIYSGMRRGGKSYYAIDASSVTAAPELLWKITKTIDGDFDELGLTFSTPNVVTVQYGATPTRALIFAGGYDTKKDSSASSADGDRSGDTEGNAIYIVNAETGDLIWKAIEGDAVATNTSVSHLELNHSIPSQVATLDANGDGVIDRLYVGDTGGSIWRVDLPEGITTDHRKDNWSITKVADVGSDDDAGDRRFFHPPEIVQTGDGDSSYDGIVIGSGDRANPLEDDDVNYLFVIKDRFIVSGIPPTGDPVSLDSLTDVTACVAGIGSVIDDDSDPCADKTVPDGWRILLDNDGEKGLSAPLVVDGKIFFTTYTPATASSATCAPAEGGSELYIVDLKDGRASFNNTREYYAGDGISGSAEAGGGNLLVLPVPPETGQELEDEISKLHGTDGAAKRVFYWREAGSDN